MTRRELDAAEVWDPRLRRSYQRCRQLHARHGRTYFLATRLLTVDRRPAVHALYGFARWVDDIVDTTPAVPDIEADAAAAAKAARLERIGAELRQGLAVGRSEHPLFAAVVHTARRYRIDPDHFTDFLTAMRMDLTVTDYPTRAALNTYIRGSAEVIGLQVLPVLGTVTSQQEAAPHAAALGNAFQLTNFIRDIAEDLDLGRIYLPADELAVFGVDRDRLLWCRRTRRVDQPVRRALADQVARARALYRFAEPGIAMLDPVARPCVATAFTLYGEILDHIARAGYNVFASRATVPAARRLAVAAPALATTLAARSAVRLSRPGGGTGRNTRAAGSGKPVSSR